MPEENFLIRNQPLDNSQDFAFLREAGITHIEKLANELWTDYNVHDPGITLLEMLCYGITDLGYRTSYDLKDLLTRSDKGVPLPNLDFHQAREIFTNGPVTFNDLRKLLVDIHGVRQARIRKNKDKKYCVDRSEKALAEWGSGTPDVTLNGLYDVYVEYEEDIDDLKVGLPDNTSGRGKYEYPDVGKMRFRVERDLIIREVYVYAEEPGLVTISLRDADGNPVLNQADKKDIEIQRAGIKTRVPLNWLVVPHYDPNKDYYTLEAIGSNVKLYANIDVEYEFEIDGLIEIIPDTDGDDIRDNYYYFYDWEIDFPDPDNNPYDDHYPTKARVGLLGREGYEGNYISPEEFSIVFNVESPITLESVHIYTDNPGTVFIEVKDDLGRVLRKKELAIRNPRVKTQVLLEVDLEPFQNYTISARADNLLLYASYDVDFPYMVPNASVITLLGGMQAGDDQLRQQYYFFYDWVIAYDKKIGGDFPEYEQTKAHVRRQVYDRVLSHRNICEDLNCVNELLPEEVGICADIDLMPDADVEEVLAEMYYRMEEHVKPVIRFYTIEELKAKGHTADQIFEGPFLEHGFIDDEEFRQLDAYRGPDEFDFYSDIRMIRASDVIRLLMDIPGITSVKNLRIVSFIEEVFRRSEQWVWCESDDPCREPNFSPKRSNIIFYKNGLPFYANREDTLDLLEDKITRDLRIRHRKHETNLPVPAGEDMELADYLPVQNDLPLNYMVGQYGVPDSESDLRKAQARQMKAFLLFFEQLFTNYLAQLGHVNELFSWRNGKVQTYFTQPLGEIAELEQLYINFPDLQKDLESIIETTKTAQDRKLRFLEHLVARFSESFTDYSLLMFNMVKEEEVASNRVIADKRAFLSDYPALSGGRGKGYDYRYPSEQTNVSGLTRRVSRLLGIQDVSRRDLAGHRLQVLEDGAGGYHFILYAADGSVMFTSVTCPSKAAVETMLDFVLKMVSKEGYYSYAAIWCEEGYQMVLNCEEEQQVVGIFQSEEDEVDATFDAILTYLKQYGNAEGLHVIEHILLRKRTEADTFLPVQIPEAEGCDCIEVEDPYSFRASVILPAWPLRFQDVNFRRFVERTLRQEAPAHVYLNICWIGHEHMRQFETVVQDWEYELACLDGWLTRHCYCNGSEKVYDGTYDESDENYTSYDEAHKAIIEALQSLEQVYPAAQLHDCAHAASDKPQVTLNQTNLSTLE